MKKIAELKGIIAGGEFDEKLAQIYLDKDMIPYNRERYVMLRKLGADEKMLNKALFKQIGLFFGFPLFIAIIHSIVGIKFCNTILLSIGRTGLLPSIIMTGAFLVVIYGGYFVITYWCSKNIIK